MSSDLTNYGENAALFVFDYSSFTKLRNLKEMSLIFADSQHKLGQSGCIEISPVVQS